MSQIKTFLEQQYKALGLITLLTGYCLLLMAIRIKITHDIFMLFLVWNLFLALIPYPIIHAVHLYTKKRVTRVILLLTWILILPNSFYILTDLVHLTKSKDELIWFDIPFISLFTILGFISGIQSMAAFEKLISTTVSSKLKEFLMTSICLLCGFGIYIGRILRYNSWDILSNPSSLLQDIVPLLIQKEPLLFSIHFGIFIYILYTSKKIFTSKLSS